MNAQPRSDSTPRDDTTQTHGIGLITRRSQVQILPPLRRNPLVSRGFLAFLRRVRISKSGLTSTGFLPPVREDERSDPIRELLLHRRDSVRVHIERKRNGRMAEALGHDLRMEPCL